MDLGARFAAWIMFRKSPMKDASGNKWLCVNAENRLAESILRRWSASGKCHKEQTREEIAHVSQPTGEISPKPDALLSEDRIQRYSAPSSPLHSGRCI
jgi:hypothetical protein